MPDIAGRCDSALVLFSILVAVVASFTAFDLIERILSAEQHRHRYLPLASLVVGIGIWSMHFVGMMAFHPNIPYPYDLPALMLSVLLPIVGSYMALYLITSKNTRIPILMAGSIFVGLAVLSMHDFGLVAMRMPANVAHSPVPVVLSALIALSIPFSVYLVQRYQVSESKFIPLYIKVVGALLLGAAIAGMHYTAIGGAVVTSHTLGTGKSDHLVIGNSTMALLIGGGTLFILTTVIIGAFWDRRRALRLADNLERRYMSLFENSPDMVICFDPEQNRIVSANPAVYRLTGYSREELDLSNMLPLYQSEQEMAAVREEYKISAETNDSRQLEVAISGRGGKPLLISLTVFPLELHGKRVIYVIGRDITSQKQAEMELSLAKEEAENANRVKGEFLAILSHEIRTPLNGIMGINQLLMETELTDKQREMLTVQEKSGHALLRVINDVLDFSKIESGTVTLAEDPFHLAGTLQTCISAFSAAAEKKGIDLLCRIDEHIPDLLEGDQVRLNQIVLNLVGNAVKFTESGSVTLQAQLAEPIDKTDSPTIVIEFKVTDTGIGIDPSRIHLLFLPFSQIADVSKGRNYEGTGLGLAICRNLVKLMGGDIWVEAGRKKGATFGFRIPFRTIGSDET
jgi:PAS domain S-box-containing protein